MVNVYIVLDSLQSTFRIFISELSHFTDEDSGSFKELSHVSKVAKLE